MNVDHRARRTRSMAIIGILFYLQSRLKPGRMLLVDTEEKKIIEDVELKLKIARCRPHSKWLKEQVAKRALLASRYESRQVLRAMEFGRITARGDEKSRGNILSLISLE